MKNKIIVLALILALFGTIGIKQIKTTEAYNSGDHNDFFVYATTLLANDGYGIPSQDVGFYLNPIYAGSEYADALAMRRRYHFHNPNTHYGFLLFDSAGEHANDKFQLAVEKYFEGNLWGEEENPGAFFYLGWALHLIQDVTVPHHSHCLEGIGNGHLDFELFCTSHVNYANDASNGIYSFDLFYTGMSEKHCDELTAFGWVDFAAHGSYDYFTYCDGNNGAGNNNYDYVAQNLMPFASQVTAGFMLFFWQATHPDSDLDGDGLTFEQELSYFTKPTVSDTDGDGINDGLEISKGLDPNDASDGIADYDNDGLSNAWELTHIDPRTSTWFNHLDSSDGWYDHDGDLLPTRDEVTFWGTHWNDDDTDGDNWSDGEECAIYGTNALNPNDTPLLDHDGDGIITKEEVDGFYIPGIGTRCTNPDLFDTDGDGFSDGYERDPPGRWETPSDPTDPNSVPSRFGRGF